MRVTHEMTVYQLAFLPRFFPVNCYLVEEDNDLTLIDTALPYSTKAILQAAHHIGKPIARILLTHADDDHIGALDALKKSLPDVQVHISRAESELANGAISKKVKTTPDVLLEEGDRIGSLLAVSTPGHSQGSMSFFDTRNHAFIVGDAMQTRGGIAVAGQIRPFFPFPGWSTRNKHVAFESVRKLRKYNPTLLATGHGRMLSQPIERIDLAISEAERNLSCK